MKRGPQTLPEVSQLTPPVAAKTHWYDQVTPYGFSLFLVALLIAGSAFRGLRLEFGRLLVHPYLIPLLALGVLVGGTRIQLFPGRVLRPLLIFLGLYCLACTQGGAHISEIIKICASLFTIVVTTLLVRNFSDYRAGVLGLAAAASLLSLRGLLTSAGLAGINPLEQVANKNALSLYTLPAILMAAHLLLDKTTTKWVRLPLAASVIASVAGIFASANRSGWLGVALIGLLMFGGKQRVKASIAIVLLACASYWALNRFSSTGTFEYRVEQSVQGYSSDELRLRLITTSFEIALAQPILGASPRRLPFELAKRAKVRALAIDPHNVLAFVAGGCGLLTFLALLASATALWRRPPNFARLLVLNPTQAHHHDLLRMLLILWLARGMFSREILYSPSFSMAFGLVLGLTMADGLWQVGSWPSSEPPPEPRATLMDEGPRR